MPYVENLVYTKSEDGLLLEGATIRPAEGPARSLAIVWVHGFTGRFYSPSAVNIGRELAGRGYIYVTGNNRGHDFGAMLRRNDGTSLLGGGGWEFFAESPHDIAGWVNFAAGLGVSGVVLVGHSLAGLKVPYYMAQRQDPHVRGIVTASPPVRGARRNDPELIALSERMVAEGRGRDLLPWDILRVGAGTQSAQSYAHRAQPFTDVYGMSTDDPAIGKISVPILAFYGTNEEWVGTAPDLDLIRERAVSAPSVTTRMFEGADHSYAGHEVEVAGAIAEWVAGLE